MLGGADYVHCCGRAQACGLENALVCGGWGLGWSGTMDLISRGTKGLPQRMLTRCGFTSLSRETKAIVGQYEKIE